MTSKYTRQDHRKITITVYLMDEQYDDHTPGYTAERMCKSLASEYDGIRVNFTTDVVSLIVPNSTSNLTDAEEDMITRDNPPVDGDDYRE